MGLVGALTTHYGSPGRLPDYWRQFERTIQTAGEDPSIFAIALETLVVKLKAFGDMSHTARLRIIRDCFIAGHASFELLRNLDSVAPDTPIQDIVDRCRVWEGHADADNRRGSRLGPERALPIYVVDDTSGQSADQTVAAVTTLPTAQLESLLRWLLPTPVAPPQPPSQYLWSWSNCRSGYWGGGDTAACTTGENWSHGDGNFAAKFDLCESVPGLSDTAGPRIPGLDCGAVFLVWKNGSWGDPVSCAGCAVSFLADGMEGGEDGERKCHDLPPPPPPRVVAERRRAESGD